jgi:hypothetical protein
VQQLDDVDGAILAPGVSARLAVFMRAEEPGRFRIRSHVVTYAVGSRLFQQSFPVGMNAQVSADGNPIPLDRAQVECLDAGRLLEGLLLVGERLRADRKARGGERQVAANSSGEACPASPRIAYPLPRE